MWVLQVICLMGLAAGMLNHVIAAVELQPTQPMKIINIDQKKYLGAEELERQAGIAIKALPGQKEVAACIDQRCALVSDSMERDGQRLVPLTTLAKALDAEIDFDPSNNSVRLRFKNLSGEKEIGQALLGVGQLAPNFRLPRLDGTYISLSELRGKRVLINSWASW